MESRDESKADSSFSDSFAGVRSSEQGRDSATEAIALEGFYSSLLHEDIAAQQEAFSRFLKVIWAQDSLRARSKSEPDKLAPRFFYWAGQRKRSFDLIEKEHISQRIRAIYLSAMLNRPIGAVVDAIAAAEPLTKDNLRLAEGEADRQLQEDIAQFESMAEEFNEREASAKMTINKGLGALASAVGILLAGVAGVNYLISNQVELLQKDLELQARERNEAIQEIVTEQAKLNRELKESLEASLREQQRSNNEQLEELKRFNANLTTQLSVLNERVNGMKENGS